MSRGVRLLLLFAWAALIAVLVPLALWGAYEGVLYVTTSGNYVSISNAVVSGDLVPVGSVNAGRVSDVRVAPGTAVRQGEVLASIEIPAAVRTTSNGTPVLGFLGSKDQEIDIVAPIDGLVATLTIANGSAVTAGQIIARIVDPSRLWVTAYVEEADVTRIHVGQSVEVRLAALDRTVPGDVAAVVPGTAVVFSLPATAAATPSKGGDALTNGRLYPIYIHVDLAENPQILGSSAAVRIRVK